MAMSEGSMRQGEQHLPLARVLVVDDRTDVARSLAMVLERMRYRVEVAHNAKDALEKGGDLRPDIIFLDIGLPDISGYDVCKEMRQSEWGLTSFIVAVTGRDSPADVIRSAQTGFDRHVSKPMDFATLKEILHVVKTRAA